MKCFCHSSVTKLKFVMNKIISFSFSLRLATSVLHRFSAVKFDPMHSQERKQRWRQPKNWFRCRKFAMKQNRTSKLLWHLLVPLVYRFNLQLLEQIFILIDTTKSFFVWNSRHNTSYDHRNDLWMVNGFIMKSMVDWVYTIKLFMFVIDNVLCP